MTNDLPKLAVGAAVSLTAAAASYADKVEQLLRMGASTVAIISGLVVIYFALRNNKPKRK